MGVEVVRILDDASLKERKHFSKEIAGKSKSTLSAKTTDELSKYKGSVYTARDLGILDSDVITTHCYTLHEKFDRVLKIIDRKIELLQKCYSNLDKSYLYILYDMNISCSKVEKIFEHCYKTQQKSKKRFCGIFIDDGSKLYRYNFSNGTILEKEILSAAQEIFIMTEMDINGV